MTLIMKFGGNAVGTVTTLTQVLSIILHEQKRWERLVVVVSALDGVTDMLLEAAHLAQLSNQRGYRRIVATLRTRHLALIDQLPLGAQERGVLSADIDRLLFEMLDVCQSVANTPMDSLSAQVSDRVTHVGERLSARIIAALLRQNDVRGVAIDGTDILVTDDVFGNATPLLEPTRQRIEEHLIPLLNRDIIPVVTGFIGATEAGEVTTIGRGGSDYTASVLSLCLDADEVWVWSDVDGMMTTDPRERPEAQVIPTLTYEEVSEMAHFGAKILHPRMIKPLARAEIALRIKNIYRPQLAGTLIKHGEHDVVRMKAVTVAQAVRLETHQPGSLLGVLDVIDRVFFAHTGNVIDILYITQSSVKSSITFVIPTSAGIEGIEALCSQIGEHLAKSATGTKWGVEPVYVLTLVGRGIGKDGAILRDVLGLLDGIDLLAIEQGASDCGISIVLSEDMVEDTVKRLHDHILKHRKD